MKKLALTLAASGMLALSIPLQPVGAAFESREAKSAAADAAFVARQDMFEAFGKTELKAGQYLWRDVPGNGSTRVVVSLDDQLAFLYKGDTLVAASTISSGTSRNPTPTGIFPILEKKRFHRSIKYENAPMPFMQRIDEYGVALHGGHLPGYPASHGCIRLPAPFAAKLFAVTTVGTPVLVGAS